MCRIQKISFIVIFDKQMFKGYHCNSEEFLKLCLLSLYPCIIYLYLGPIAQTNTGELVVYPGTILHMECLFLKKFGSPSWTTRRGFKPEPYPYP